MPLSSTFLDRVIDEEVFVFLPDGFSLTDPPPSPIGAIAGASARMSIGAAMHGAVARGGALRGAHPALDARYSRDDEELLAEIEAEIDRELAGELRSRGRVSAKRLGIAAAILAPFILPYILVVGWPYYSLPVTERIFHPFHPVLRSSGSVGLPLGIVGLGTMFANMAYLVRKRLVVQLGIRGLPAWLRFHIVTGLVGPLFAWVHAGFVPTSAMGLFALTSLAIIVGSGILGRYLLAYLPRSTTDEAVAIDEVRRRLTVYKRKLMAMGIRTAHLDIEPRAVRSREPGVFTSLFRVLLGDRTARREVRRLREAIEEKSYLTEHAEPLLLLVGRLCKERQWLIRSQEIRRLIVAWRLFHRWFAIVLFTAIAFHVWVALRFGGGN